MTLSSRPRPPPFSFRSLRPLSHLPGTGNLSAGLLAPPPPPGLAAPGFLSWDTLGASVQDDVQRGVDPFALG